MNDITIKRGLKSVTFKKLPNYFAVKLKSGKASNEAALEAACGRPPSEVSHVESVATGKMEIFTLKDHTELEKTTDRLRQAPASDFPLATKIHGIIHKAATQGRFNGKGCVILFAAGNENRPLDGEINGVTSHRKTDNMKTAILPCTGMVESTPTEPWLQQPETIPTIDCRKSS